MQKRQTIRVGVIGAGRIGSLHAEHLATRIPEAEIVAVSDIRREAAERCARAWDIPEVYEAPGPMMVRDDIDAVLICSSTDTHAALIEQAADAGKHIFCEKPIDLEIARIDRALAAVSNAGVTLMVGFNRRFDHNFRRLRERVAGGDVGEPHLLHIISRDPAPPPLDYIKVSGGIFLDMTIHDFDMARYLMDSEVEELHAMGAVRVDPAIGKAGDLDTAVITMRFANGAIGTIDNSRQAVYGYDQRAEVFGSRGVVRSANDYPNTAMLADADGVRRDNPLYFFIERYTQSYVDELRAFIRSVTEGTPPPTTGEDGRIAILMGYAAKRSVAEARPVTMEEIEMEY
jgi:myo-inositol 2-dehydrogenase/D-chiro-inositol 1-dehydrogenase